MPHPDHETSVDLAHALDEVSLIQSRVRLERIRSASAGPPRALPLPRQPTQAFARPFTASFCLTERTAGGGQQTGLIHPQQYWKLSAWSAPTSTSWGHVSGTSTVRAPEVVRFRPAFLPSGLCPGPMPSSGPLPSPLTPGPGCKRKPNRRLQTGSSTGQQLHELGLQPVVVVESGRDGLHPLGCGSPPPRVFSQLPDPQFRPELWDHDREEVAGGYWIPPPRDEEASRKDESEEDSSSPTLSRRPQGPRSARRPRVTGPAPLLLFLLFLSPHSTGLLRAPAAAEL